MGLSQRNGNQPRQALDRAGKRRAGPLKADSFPEETCWCFTINCLGKRFEKKGCNQALLAPEISFSQYHDKHYYRELEVARQ